MLKRLLALNERNRWVSVFDFSFDVGPPADVICTRWVGTVDSLVDLPADVMAGDVWGEFALPADAI